MIEAEVVFNENEIEINGKTIVVDTESNEVYLNDSGKSFWTIEQAIKYCMEN